MKQTHQVFLYDTIQLAHCNQILQGCTDFYKFNTDDIHSATDVSASMFTSQSWTAKKNKKKQHLMNFAAMLYQGYFFKL